MLHSFQFLDHITNQLLQHKATQATESAQLDEKIQQAEALLQRSLFKANERLQKFKDNDVEATENHRLYLSLINDLKNLQMRRAGQCLLAKQSLDNYEKIKAKLAEQSSERVKCIGYIHQSTAHAAAAQKSQALLCDAKKLSEDLRALRRMQSSIETLQTKILLFLQTMLKKTSVAEDCRSAACGAQTEIAKQRERVNKMTITIKNADADALGVQSAMELAKVEVESRAEVYSISKCKEGALLAEKQNLAGACGETQSRLDEEKNELQHLEDKKYAYDLHILSIESTIENQKKLALDLSKTFETRQSELAVFNEAHCLSKAISQKLDSNPDDFNDRTCALFIHFFETCENVALSKMHQNQSHALREQQLDDEKMLLERREVYIENRKLFETQQADFISFACRSAESMREELSKQHIQLVDLFKSEKENRIVLLNHETAGHSTLTADIHEGCTRISFDMQERVHPPAVRSPSNTRKQETTPPVSHEKVFSKSPSISSSSSRRRLRRFFSPTLQSTGIARKLSFVKDTPIVHTYEEISEGGGYTRPAKLLRSETPQIENTPAEPEAHDFLFSPAKIDRRARDQHTNNAEKNGQAIIPGPKPSKSFRDKRAQKAKLDSLKPLDKSGKLKRKQNRKTRMGEIVSEFDFFEDF